MNLFEFNDSTGLPDIDPIVLEMKPFKALVARDKSKGKIKAKTELAFIWFWCDYKSDFSGIADEEKKLREILNIVDLPKEWAIDNTIKDAITFYKNITKTTTIILLEQTRKTIDKLSTFLEKIDFEETVDGKPKWDMKKIVDTTNQIPNLINTLKQLETKVKEEQDILDKKIRGDRELAVWEDGDITEL